MAAVRRVMIVMCVALGLGVGVLTSPAAAVDATIELSTSPDRSGAVPLDGATLSGAVYVFASIAEPVNSVRFFLDDPSMSGTPAKVESRAPYDLAGTASDGSALPFDAAGLTSGSHTVTIDAALTAGGTVTATASFTVAAAPPPPPPPPDSTVDLLVSLTPDRGAPAPVEGAVLAGDVYVFAESDAAVKEVRFFLDNPTMSGTPDKIEKGAPYDLAGTASDRSAKPFDADALAPGGHTITTRTLMVDGTVVVTQAAFSTPDAPQGTPREPDQVHLSWTAAPSTTLTVVWRTASSASPSQVEYRRAGTASWSSESGGLRPSGTTGTLHQVNLTGLTPDTAYEYRVPGDGGVWSEVFTTRTAPAPGPADFDVVYFADTGIAGRADGLTTGTAQAMTEIEALDPLMVLPGGDYAYFNTETRYADVDEAIDAWFNQVQPIVSSAPMMPVYGNHEALLGETVADWAPRFATPSGWNGSRAYSFDVADAHFVALYAVTNTTKLESGQITWLRNDLAAAQARGARWIVPYFHVSPFADGYSHSSNEALRAQLGPIFEEFDVDVVLTSHDQSYERTFALTDVGVTNAHTTEQIDCLDTSEGTTYVKTSPAGKLSNRNGTFSVFQTYPAPAWAAVRDDTMHHFSRLHFTADGRLRVETFGFSGDGSTPVLVDAFEYRADGGCTDGPTLSVAPDDVTFTATAEQPTGSASVEVVPSDGASTPLTLSEGASWLTVPASTTTGPVTFDIDATGLAGGVHATTVLISSATHGVTRVHVSVTVPAVTTDRLAFSKSSSRSAPLALEGAVVTGTVYVFTDGGDDAVTQVRFYLDDPTASGTPYRTENTAPYDFAGGTVSTARGWDTSKVTAGTHTITAVVVTPTGSHSLSATFEVG